MNPPIWGVIGPGFLNQVPTLFRIPLGCVVWGFGFRVWGLRGLGFRFRRVRA